MSVLLQILAAVGAFGGWIVALTQLHRQHSRQARELSDLRDRIAGRERAITKILARYREAHRQLVLQLEQADIQFEIEAELSERLATAEGGKAIAKKREARTKVVERRGGDLDMLTGMISPSSIRDLRERVDETLLETIEAELEERRPTTDPIVDRSDDTLLAEAA